jgi:protein-S-isoprenylcysteine O-methyltransferase Ste14
MKKINPPLIYKIFIGLMVLSLLLPINRQVQFPYNLTGLLPFVFGSYMALASKKLFKQTSTPMHPFSQPTQLHQRGFFKYSRNPMYLGIAIGLFGLAILSGHLFNLVYPALYIFFCDALYVRAEEKNLKEKFGSTFIEYKQRTRRWI